MQFIAIKLQKAQTCVTTARNSSFEEGLSYRKFELLLVVLEN